MVDTHPYVDIGCEQLLSGGPTFRIILSGVYGGLCADVNAQRIRDE